MYTTSPRDVKRQLRSALVPVGRLLVRVRGPEHGRLAEPAGEREPDRKAVDEAARDARRRQPGQLHGELNGISASR